MRDDAARALRVDDDMPPRHRAELRSVSSIDDAYAELRARASERGFERTPETASALRARASERHFERPAMAAVAVEEPVGDPRVALEEPAPEPGSLPRTAPGRAYGAHRRADGHTPIRRVAGPQPGRRTVEITGQVEAPRRRSQTATAFQARPDRAALWAFLLALFLVAMAVATAHG
jgi:hypothetical protein